MDLSMFLEASAEGKGKERGWNGKHARTGYYLEHQEVEAGFPWRGRSVGRHDGLMVHRRVIHRLIATPIASRSVV
jgi:hypothetical protein